MKMSKKSMNELLTSCQELKDLGLLKSFEVKNGEIKIEVSELFVKLAPQGCNVLENIILGSKDQDSYWN